MLSHSCFRAYHFHYSAAHSTVTGDARKYNTTFSILHHHSPIILPGVSGRVAFRVPGSAGKAGWEPSMLGNCLIFSEDVVLGRWRLVRLVRDLAMVP
jgi:hypothetical protein